MRNNAKFAEFCGILRNFHNGKKWQKMARFGTNWYIWRILADFGGF